MAAESNCISYESTTDNQGNYTARLEYIVSGVAGDASDSTILAVSGIPALDDVLAGSGGAVANKITIRKNHDPGKTATVTVEYSTKPLPGAGPDSDRDPLTDPPKISIVPGGAVVELRQDFSTPKKSYRNSAGGLLQPAPTAEESRPILVFERNEASIPISAIVNHSNTINESAFELSTYGETVTVEARSAYFLGVSASQALYTDADGDVTVYWVCQYQFALKKGGWNPTIRGDWGMCQLLEEVDDLDMPTGRKIPTPITYKGQPVTDPVALNGAGKVVDLANPNAQPAPLTFKDYEETDFGDMELS